MSEDVLVPYVAWTPSPFGPRIMRAGRVDAIACNPLNDREVLVGTETGGLFRSVDGANTFTHVATLPKQHISDIAFVRNSPTVVIAATHADFKSDSNPRARAIWRSTDGGITWAPSPDSPPHPVHARRLSSHSITEEPSGAPGVLYVATNRGLATSTNGGVTWGHDYVFPPVPPIVDPITGDTVGDDPEVVSVKAIGQGIVLAGGPSGLRRRNPVNGTWQRVTDASGRQIPIASPHALDGNGSLAFAASSDGTLLRSETGGSSWLRFANTLRAPDNAGGKAFVRLRFHGFNEVDIYYGNRLRLYRLRISRRDVNSPFDFSGSWAELMLDHSDPRCIAWNNRNEPYLLGTDGGLHRASDDGGRWSYTAGCSGGLNALQICEVTGQVVGHLGRNDLYFGTQDNDLWSSSDSGATWPTTQTMCCEGFYIQGSRRAPDDASSRIVYWASGSGECRDIFISQPLFRNRGCWSHPANAFPKVPTLIEERTYVQALGHRVGRPLEPGLAITFNFGANWDQCGVFLEETRGLAKPISGDWLTIYQPIRLGFDARTGTERVGLIKIVRSRDGSTFRRYPRGLGLGGFGVSPTMFAWYEVLAVNPANANHLIAADAIRGRVVHSFTGGEEWMDVRGLEALVTRSGQYHFSLPEGMRQTIVTAISFCPDNPRLLLLGTREGGIYASNDRGFNWLPVVNSEEIQPVTAFHWQGWNNVVVSTYGRGLWRLRGEVRMRWTSRPSLLAGASKFVVISAQSLTASQPISHLIFGGTMMGVEVADGRVARIHLTPGSSHVTVTDDDSVVPPEVVETAKNVGFIGVDSPPEPPAKDWMIVGLTIERDGQLEVMYAPKLMEFPGVRDHTDYKVQPDDPSPRADQPYLWLSHKPEDPQKAEMEWGAFLAGEMVYVRGARFGTDRPEDLKFTIDEGVVKAEVLWMKPEEFEATFTAPLEIGAHTLVVRAASLQGESVDGVAFVIRHQD